MRRKVQLAVLLGACLGLAIQTQPKWILLKASGLESVSFAGHSPVIVHPDVVNGWRFLYRYVTEVEFVLCLEGMRAASGKIFVEDFRLARIDGASSSTVRYQPCTSERHIGTAHNHPPQNIAKSLCYQSLPDKRSFEADDKAVLDIVLCGYDRFLWVTRNDGVLQQGEIVLDNRD